jgi:hypothetical protein
LSEREIETLILQWLNLNGCKAWKNDSVGIWDPTRKVYRKRNGPFNQKGTSDILGILPGGRMLAIEVKSAKGTLSPEQRYFIDEINKRGD